jgi:hypothetical protein
MRVLLVGDVRQHVSVEAGDFLRVLEAHSKLGRCQVQEIHRQIPDDYRAAVTHSARHGGFLLRDEPLEQNLGLSLSPVSA